MKQKQTLRLTLAALLCAVAVVGSLLSFPVFGSKCAPVQHVVNVLCAVLLGPWYGTAVAFAASLLRNFLGLGSLLAFPGSMCGALLSGLVYKACKRILPAAAGEVVGTGILGGLLAYPMAVAFMSVDAASIAFYGYIIPFLVSTVVGSALAWVILVTLQKAGALAGIRQRLG